jgi:hypothetical protein
MAYAMCLQDWTTVTSNVSAPNPNITVNQPEPCWLDVSDFQDFAIYVEVANTSSAATLYIQTSPTKDEAFFGAAGPGGGRAIVTFSPLSTSGVQGIQVVRWNGPVPNQLAAAWMRWQVSFNNPGAPSFRIWVVGNQAGRRWNRRDGTRMRGCGCTSMMMAAPPLAPSIAVPAPQVPQVSPLLPFLSPAGALGPTWTPTK